MKKDLAYYRQLPYSRNVTREEHEGELWFVVTVDELPDLVAAGQTRAEAMAEMDRAFDSFIEAQLAWGSEIPEPAHRPRIAGPDTKRIRVQFKERRPTFARPSAVTPPHDEEPASSMSEGEAFEAESELVNA